MGGHEVDPQLEQRVKELALQTGASMVDLNTVKTCEMCGESYQKRLPGRDICGSCQVAMAVVMHHNAELYRRFGVIYIG